MPYYWAPGALDRLPDDIEAYEVAQALEPGRPRLPQSAEAQGFPVLVMFGRTRGGRLLVTVMRHVDGLTWHLLATREPTKAEAAWFAKWEGTQR